MKHQLAPLNQLSINGCVLALQQAFKDNKLMYRIEADQATRQTKRLLYGLLKQKQIKFYFYADESMEIFIDPRVNQLQTEDKVIHVDFVNKKVVK